MLRVRGVSGPLIPYIDGASYEIGLGFLQYIPFLGDKINPADPPSIKPFGTLVAIGVYLGSVITMRHARKRKIDTALMSDFIFWVVATGFVVSHVLDAVFYHPDTVAKDPVYLLKIWDGLSSYGGFIGSVMGAFAWKFYRRKPIMEMVDITVAAFPLAWVFGRAGCSIVHDHPGAVTDAWFAVKYPNTICPAGFPPDAVCGRYDLGFIEMVLTIPLAALCLWLWHKRPLRPHGFYVGLTLTAYAPVRFLLDFLRVDPNELVFRGATDPRYAGLTPAQWACFLALGMGIYFLRKALKSEYVPTTAVMLKEDDAAEKVSDESPAKEAKAAAKEADEATPRAKKKKKKKRVKKKVASPEPGPAEGA